MPAFDNYSENPPAASFTQGTVSVGTAATLVCTTPHNPSGVLISASATCVIGGSTVTATGATAGVSIAANTPTLIPTLGDAQCELYAIVATGTANVSYCYPTA